MLTSSELTICISSLRDFFLSNPHRSVAETPGGFSFKTDFHDASKSPYIGLQPHQQSE
jgi:hypothetical protein